ncbi:MAG TPA: type II toxin-antitoxin system Phd/YefM family antitoxin [Polyangiales bacterium]|nr:type II toxin-antitoxin system Phd/YefM family antitoxin [Polyangiales bacterium]
MKVVNLHAAKTHLSKLVDEVAGGGEIVIAKAGRPVARLVGVLPAAPREPGLLAGQLDLADDFDAPLPSELLALFEGGTTAASAKKKPKRSRP